MSRAAITPAPGAKKQSRPREPWIIRTYAGFGDARQANRRFLENLGRGQRGLSIAFDLPTQNGYDPDAPVAAGEVGKAGVSICHWQRHGGVARRNRPGRDQHLDDDQRDRAVSARALPGGRREARRAMDRAARHDPERSAQGIRRARHLDFPSRGLASASRPNSSASRSSGCPTGIRSTAAATTTWKAAPARPRKSATRSATR